MLVSIIVATYNCAEYIEDALNSVYRQTYKDLELVVTDDCSTDNSIDVAQKWINEHKKRFIRTIQTKTTHNSGVTANYNTGLSEARGEWVKCLDGDDMLPDDAIETYVQFALSNQTHTVWYANEQTFDNNDNRGFINKKTIPTASYRKQMIYLLNHRLLGICTATNFINRTTFLSQGGFDSRFPMYQDGSPFLKSLAARTPIGIIDKVLLLKRENPDSLMHTANPMMVSNIRDCHYLYCRYYLRYFMPLHYYNAFVTYWLSTHDTTLPYNKAIGYLLRSFDIINLYRKLCSSL